MAHIYETELTDTFGGEANYSWVKRGTIAVPEWDRFSDWDGNGRREPRGYQAYVMREAKRKAGLTGVRGRTYAMGDGYEFRPYGMNVVLFVSYKEAAVYA